MLDLRIINVQQKNAFFEVKYIELNKTSNSVGNPIKHLVFEFSLKFLDIKLPRFR